MSHTEDNQPISCIIVDDERPARDGIANYIAEYCPNVRVLEKSDSVKSAFMAISNLNPDVVFLDIEMPNGNGFELLRMFNPIPFKVIFVTAFSQYAVDAFRFTAVDYLMKPVKISELVGAVKKVEKEIKDNRSLGELLNLLEGSLLQNVQNRQLIISDTKGFSVVRTNEVVMLEADGYCTRLILSDGQIITSSRNLKFFEDLLNDRTFMRVHNSNIVNLEHVKGYSHQEEIRLTGNRVCPLSRIHKKHFMDHYKNRH